MPCGVLQQVRLGHCGDSGHLAMGMFRLKGCSCIRACAREMLPQQPPPAGGRVDQLITELGEHGKPLPARLTRPVGGRSLCS